MEGQAPASHGGLPQKIRVLRIIARLNVGGPAHHVSLVSGGLDPKRYDTLLVAGRVNDDEGSFDELAWNHGARLHTVPDLGPAISPLRDLRALLALVRLARRFRPDIVHTHTAKAGMLGRLAALTVRPRPAIVHTYHGHVLEGYFGPLKTGVFRTIERLLGRVSDRLVGVSQATVDDLVRLKVAPRSRFEVIPLGLRLDALLGVGASDGCFRSELGLSPDAVLVSSIGRLVPIKRIDVLLRAIATAREREPRITVAVIGDGESRPALESQAREIGLGDAVRFLGFRRDLPAIFGDSDLVLLTSDNEGTPVSLIEAAAAGRPAVATSVGGVPDVVTADTGVLCPAGDADAVADAIVELARDPERRMRMGDLAREHVRRRFSVDRLLADIDDLYTTLLAERDVMRKTPSQHDRETVRA